ncbi:MAG: efflux RND transporter permease subunit [Vulcanimicrobiaceae bacterium]
MWLTRFAITRPVITAMVFIGLALYGLVSYRSLGVNLFPNVSFPIVAVHVGYPGASPAEMEKLIIKPIEDQLDGMENLDRLSATAQEGSATIIARFKLDSDLNYETIDVQRRVDTARINMPSDLVPPSVTKFGTGSDPILEEAVSSRKLGPTQLSDLVSQRIVPELKAVPGVLSVDTAGDTSREIHVYPDQSRLLAANATLADLNGVLERNNANLPGGRIDAPTQETTVSVHADIAAPQDILRVPVPVPGGAQRYLTVGDLARVDDGHVEQRRPTHYNGRASILLEIQRQIDADTLKTTGLTRIALAKIAREFPDVTFAEIDASADYTNASVNGVLQSLFEGIVLTAFVMLLFLHAWRNAVVVMIAIPTSLLATFIVMKLLGFTVDVISLMGLGLTIGILVDDSIVVLENITRHRDELGEGAMEAAFNGRTEIGNAAVAITLVDVVVFLPIAFLSGIVGKYMKEFGIVIVVATLFSLLVSFTLTPLLAGRWSVRRRSTGVPWWARAFQAAFDRLGRWYAERALPWCLRHRILVPAVCFALIVGAIALVPLGFIGSEFVPSSNTGVLNGSVQYAIGQPLATTARAVGRLEQKLLAIDGVASVVTTVGAKRSGFGNNTGGHVAQFTVILDKQRRRESDRVLATAQTFGYLVPGADYQLAKEGGGGSGGSAIRFTMTGPDAALDAAALQIAALVRQQPGAVNVSSGAENKGPRLNIHIDPARASVLGIAPGEAAIAARIAIGGVIATKVRLDNGLTDVRLELPPAQRNDMSVVEQVRVRAAGGALVPLARVADFTTSRAPTKIERQARERVVRVSADVDPNANVSLGAILKPIYAKINEPGFLPSGVHALADGDADLYNQTFSSMGFALATSFLLVYMLMVVLYGSFVEPFVVMFSVPVAIVGALGGLALHHQTLNLFSLIAIVMLFGLVAKNGILLVDYANQQRKRLGLDVRAAMLAAAATRFRPILMTTFAMIFGMLPLSLGLTEGAEERASMGTVLIGGLLSSLILTLALVPVMYTFIMGAADKRARKRAAKRARDGEHTLPEYERPVPLGASGD